MIRFNWYKLRWLFRARMAHDRELNGRRPWWLHVGQVYYVAGNDRTRWVLASFDSDDPQGVVVTPATFERGTETVHVGAIVAHPPPLIRGAT